MQREIDDRLATALIAGNISDGDHVVVDVAPTATDSLFPATPQPQNTMMTKHS
jgi:hypothetical protein